MKLTDIDFVKVFEDLISLLPRARSGGQATRYEWLRMLASSDDFFRDDFSEASSTSSRHPANWLIGLATRMRWDAAPGDEALEWYVKRLLTNGERQRAGSGILAGEHVGEFLALDWESVSKWERRRLTGREDRYLSSREILEELQNGLRDLLRTEGAATIDKVIDVSDGWRSDLHRAVLFAGFRHLLIFPCIVDNTFAIVPWPFEHSSFAPEHLLVKETGCGRGRPRLPTLPEPVVETPTEQWGEPRVPQDLFCLLQAATTSRLRVKMDWDLYVKSARTVAEGMQALPGWLVVDDVERANGVFSRAQALDWVDVASEGKAAIVRVTRAGKSWMARSAADRTRAVLDLLRRPEAVTKRFGIRFLPYVPMRSVVGFSGDRHDALARHIHDYLAELFGLLEQDTFYDRNGFLDSLQGTDHPLVQPELFEYRRHMPEPDLQDMLWTEFVYAFMGSTLLSYGGVRFGLLDETRLAFALTATGRYMLGLTDSWEPRAEDGRVVLQPNFELTFLAPCPAALAALAPYCERVGEGQVGTLLKVSRPAVTAALRQGGEAEQILEELGAHTEAVPENVATEVRSWCDSVLRVDARRVTVVECPDAAAAARVLAAGRKYLEPLTETVLVLKAGAKRRTVANALAKKGIFLT